MYLQSLIQEIKESIPAILEESGSIVYSSVSSICKGDLYVMGLNPGGDSGDSINQTLSELTNKVSNSYKDEKWGIFDAGNHPLQKNYLSLMSNLVAGNKEVFSTNLIFTRSRNADGSFYPDRAKLCWETHKKFIKVVDPNCFIVFGNSSISPYNFIKNHYNLKDSDCIESEHGSWKCFSSVGMIEGRERLLIGVPHLSRYYICYRPGVMKWIKDKIDNFK